MRVVPTAAAILGCAALLALPSAPARAQNRAEARVQARVLSLAAEAASQGWRHTGEPLTGELRQGEREALRVALREGGHYAIAAVCDSGCRNLDIAVVGEDDVALARSADGDAGGLLVIRPRATAKYRVLVTMSQCVVNPCAYGVAILQR